MSELYQKTIMILDDRIYILEDGYNVIENTIYDDEAVKQAKKLLKRLGAL